MIEWLLAVCGALSIVYVGAMHDVQLYAMFWVLAKLIMENMYGLDLIIL